MAITYAELEEILARETGDRNLVSPPVRISQHVFKGETYVSTGRLLLCANEDYDPAEVSDENIDFTGRYIIQAYFDLLPNGKVGYNDEHPEFNGSETLEGALNILAEYGVTLDNLEPWNEEKHQATDEEWAAWNKDREASGN